MVPGRRERRWGKRLAIRAPTPTQPQKGAGGLLKRLEETRRLLARHSLRSPAQSVDAQGLEARLFYRDA